MKKIFGVGAIIATFASLASLPALSVNGAGASGNELPFLTRNFSGAEISAIKTTPYPTIVTAEMGAATATAIASLGLQATGITEIQTTATALATIVVGTITEITVTHGGSGYPDSGPGPTVTITGDGTGATAIASYDPYTEHVTSITVTSGGTGYTTATVTIAPPIKPGGVSYVLVTNGGSGYTSPPAVTFTGGGGKGVGAEAVITAGVVTAANLTYYGDDYTSPPTVTIDPPGTITSVIVIDGGFGYTAPPAVTFSGGGGTGASAIATIAGGVVVTIVIIEPGSGYTSVPTVTISSPGTVLQTRLTNVAPNVMSPGDTKNMLVTVDALPAGTSTLTAGLPVQFDNVVYNLETASSTTGSTTIATDATGTSTLPLIAPMAMSVMLYDAVFTGSADFNPSSNMNIISVVPIIAAKITATSSNGDIIFHLADQFGNAMSGQTLTFLSTTGTLSVAGGITNAIGDVSTTISGATSAVVSASFGGYINAEGWAYQPTMARITVFTAATTHLQTALIITADNVVSPGDDITLGAAVNQLPGLTPVTAAGLTLQFDYVIFNLETATTTTSSVTGTTDANGIASLSLPAPMAKSVVLVDAVFFGSGSLGASSNMMIISVLPIVRANIIGRSTIPGVFTFHLADQYGNAMADQTLTFLSTIGSLSVASGVTNATGDTSVTLTEATAAVVSASFGGYINPSGWAYQPTMVRITWP